MAADEIRFVNPSTEAVVFHHPRLHPVLLVWDGRRFHLAEPGDPDAKAGYVLSGTAWVRGAADAMLEHVVMRLPRTPGERVREALADRPGAPILVRRMGERLDTTYEFTHDRSEVGPPDREPDGFDAAALFQPAPPPPPALHAGPRYDRSDAHYAVTRAR